MNVAVEPPCPEDKPTITVNDRQLVAVVADAWKAVRAANDPPFLFQHAGRLTRLLPLSKGLQPVAVSVAELYGLLARVADWVRSTPTGLVPAKPPYAVAADMRRFPAADLPSL